MFVYGCMHVCGYFLRAVECVLNPPWIWKWYRNHMNGGTTTEPPIIKWNEWVREKGRPRWKRSLFLHCFSSSFHEIHNHIMRDNRTNERMMYFIRAIYRLALHRCLCRCLLVVVLSALTSLYNNNNNHISLSHCRRRCQRWFHHFSFMYCSYNYVLIDF